MGHKKSSQSDVFRVVAAAGFGGSAESSDEVDADMLQRHESMIDRGLETAIEDGDEIARREWKAPAYPEEDEDDLGDEDVGPIDPEDMITDLFMVKPQSAYDVHAEYARRREAALFGTPQECLDDCAERLGSLDDLSDSSSDPSADDPMFDPTGKNLFSRYYVIRDILEQTAPYLSYDVAQDLCQDLLDRFSEEIMIPRGDKGKIVKRILGDPRMLDDSVREVMIHPVPREHALAMSEIYDRDRIVFALSRLAGRDLNTTDAWQGVLRHYDNYVAPSDAKQLCIELKRHHGVNHLPLRKVLSNPGVLDPTRDLFDKDRVVAAITSEVKKYLP